jgi:hypothetical protein
VPPLDDHQECETVGRERLLSQEGNRPGPSSAGGRGVFYGPTVDPPKRASRFEGVPNRPRTLLTSVISGDYRGGNTRFSVAESRPLTSTSQPVGAKLPARHRGARAWQSRE